MEISSSVWLSLTLFHPCLSWSVSIRSLLLPILAIHFTRATHTHVQSLCDLLSVRFWIGLHLSDMNIIKCNFFLYQRESSRIFTEIVVLVLLCGCKSFMMISCVDLECVSSHSRRVSNTHWTKLIVELFLIRRSSFTQLLFDFSAVRCFSSPRHMCPTHSTNSLNSPSDATQSHSIEAWSHAKRWVQFPLKPNRITSAPTEALIWWNWKLSTMTMSVTNCGTV